MVGHRAKFTLIILKRVSLHTKVVNCFNSWCFVPAGVYVCSKCGNELFHSTKKFEHSSPWPAFTETVKPDSVAKHKESASALKVRCAKCGNGLGHEFLNDGPTRGQSRF